MPTDCSCWSGLASPPKPLRCGVLWFLHIGKTGGTSVEALMQNLSMQRRWRYHRMYYSDRTYQRWNSSAGWHRILRELQSSKPMALVSHHHTAPGMDAGGPWGSDDMLRSVLLPLRRSLEARGCNLTLVTVLREPTTHLRSVIYFNSVNRSKLADWMVRRGSNSQTKYILMTDHFPHKAWNSTEDRRLLAPALSVLRHFDLVGRTEELGDFLSVVRRALGLRREASADSAARSLSDEASAPAPKTMSSSGRVAAGAAELSAQARTQLDRSRRGGASNRDVLFGGRQPMENVTPMSKKYALTREEEELIARGTEVDKVLYEHFCSTCSGLE